MGHLQLTLPDFDRNLASYPLVSTERRDLIRGGQLRSRVVYAAAHVVCDPLTDTSPAQSPCLDWDATLAFRWHLWSLGLRVAEAMDTAQRGSGLDWTVSQELIRRSLADARAVSGGIACGAGTDHLPSVDATAEQ